MRRGPLFIALGGLALALSSCTYQLGAVKAREAGGPVPWWCTSTEEIPVTAGPAVGTVDWYAGIDKAPLAWDDCVQMSGQFDQAKRYAEQWLIRGAAEADGFREITSYIPGMGTHHVRGGITPAMLADPSFDPDNPILDNARLDGVFDPSKPEVLQFDGGGPAAKLVGFDYYVRTTTGNPPAGFPGNLDWWHHHPVICHRKSDAAMIAFNVSDANCESRSGVNVNLSNYYMLHVWVLDDMKFIPDVFAGQMPCIFAGTAIHDTDDPCHFSRPTETASANAITSPIAAVSTGRRSFVCHLEEGAAAS